MNESWQLTSLSSSEEGLNRVSNNSQPPHPWQPSPSDRIHNGDFEVKDDKEIVSDFLFKCWDETREYRYKLSLILKSFSCIVPLNGELSSFEWSSFCCWWFGSENPFLSDGFMCGRQWLEGQSSQWSSSAETWTFIQQSSEKDQRVKFWLLL